MVEGHVLGNLFSSNPGYDEASGPERDDRYYLVDEFAWEWTEEDEKEYINRIYFQDPDEPLGPGETEASVREDMKDRSPLITVDPDYLPNFGPAKTACRRFNSAETLPVKVGVMTVVIKKFDRKAKRWMKAQSCVTVSVRRTKLH
ncbi:MAG: hypothetical protein WC814_01840 [Candidatus Paceibacterota bacterium]|jgi:hypothetical protein